MKQMYDFQLSSFPATQTFLLQQISHPAH